MVTPQSAPGESVDGVDEPPVKKVSWLTIAQVVLVPVALLGLAAAVDDLDVEQLGHQLGDASWGLIVLWFAFAQARPLGQAGSAKGASPVPLPNGPTYLLQLAIQYVNVMIPGGAARVALNVRFFQRHGLAAGSALAVAALDGLAGLFVQIVVVGGFLLAGVTALDFDFDFGGTADESHGMRLLVAVVVGLLVVAALAFPVRRRRAVAWVRQALHDAADVLRGLHSPRRIGLLVAGNLAADLVLTLTLAGMLRAFHQHVPFGELWLIVMTVGILAWIIPVPGGIGVTEALLVIGLTAAGIREEPAFAAVIIYRVATFYGPPAWGFFALRRLEREGFV